MIDLEELPDCLPQQLHHFTSSSLGESTCVWAANALLTLALSTALGPSLQWIHCAEGVNTLWWGCEWCVNEERCMKSCTYLLYDVRSSEVSMYLWNRHASLCSKRITSKWLLLPWEGSVSASCAGGHFLENECIRFVCRKWVYHMFTFNLLNAMGQ